MKIISYIFIILIVVCGTFLFYKNYQSELNGISVSAVVLSAIIIFQLINKILLEIGRNTNIEQDKLKKIVREMFTNPVIESLDVENRTLFYDCQMKIESLIEKGEINNISKIERFIDSSLLSKNQHLKRSKKNLAKIGKSSIFEKKK
jgi:hypothetical protein